MQVDKRKIESSLSKKGFIKDETHHTYFYYEHNGKKTGIYTYISHGSKSKVCGNPLLSMMKKQLKLDTINQVVDLFECPMSHYYSNSSLIIFSF